MLSPFQEPKLRQNPLLRIVRVIEQGRELNGFWSMLAAAYGRAGQQPEAQRALDKLLEMNRRQQIDPSALIWAYIGMGNKDQAFIWLEKAYSQHANLTTLKVDPIYDPLRSDPRFQDLLRRVGLAQ